MLSSFPFEPRTVLAPMEGVTHAAFRALMAERGGLGLVCTEFVRITSGPLTAKGMARSVVKAPGVPLCVQVMGSDEQRMAEAADLMVAAGADVVDVNLGCPMPKIVKKGVGAALLKDLPRLSRILGAIRTRVPGLFSAKIRAGFDSSDDALAIARAVEDAGVDYIVVHPRRRSDLLNGVADWRTIQLIKEALRIPVVGNGDCWYAVDAARMRRETGCDAVMIGRPALRNPWIFSQIAALEAGRTPHAPSGAELYQFIASTAAYYRAAFPEKKSVVGKLKELVSYLARAVDDQNVFRTAALRTGSTEELIELCRARLFELSPEALDLDAHGRLGLERSGSSSST